MPSDPPPPPPNEFVIGTSSDALHICKQGDNGVTILFGCHGMNPGERNNGEGESPGSRVKYEFPGR
jgi:hypothetical protein